MSYYTALFNGTREEIDEGYRSFLPPHLYKMQQEANAAELEIYQAIDQLEEAAEAERKAGNETEAKGLTLKAIVLACELSGKLPERNTKARTLGRKFQSAVLLHIFRDRQTRRINCRLAGSVFLPSFAAQMRGIRASRARRKPSPTTGQPLNGPDDPDPDPDPERPYIALGIDYKADTPAGPPVPVSFRFFPLSNEMRYCHESNRPDSPRP